MIRQVMPPLPAKLKFHHSDADVCILDEGRLAGLRHRTVIDAAQGARGLALWQEEHLPGFFVPLHLHDCEEIITVIEGEIEAHVEDLRFRIGPAESVLIPELRPHGFTVISPVPVRLLAIFASPDPKIYKLDGSTSLPPWAGGSGRQFD